MYITSLFSITDNSGALTFSCLKIYGKLKHSRSAEVGDIILGCIQTYNAKRLKKQYRKKLMKALCLSIPKAITLCDGRVLLCMYASVIILHKDNLPLARRIFCPIPKILIKNGHYKIAALTYALV